MSKQVTRKWATDKETGEDIERGVSGMDEEGK